MLAPSRDLTDIQWAILDPLIPEPENRAERRGVANRCSLADVPDRCPSFQTCHRRFQTMVRSGVMKGIPEALALDLKAQGGLDVREAFIDGTFAQAKKGALKLEKQSVAKERRSWQWPTVMAFQRPYA